jgi:DNA polymerase-3 subunit gamma/tau
LKTLEEPPEYLKFVLATTDPQKVPVTVLSRCLQFNLRPMAPETVLEHLTRVLALESVPAEEGALRLLARAARGSMRDALSLTDQAIAFGNGQLLEGGVRQMLGSVDRSHVFRVIAALAAGDGRSVVETTDALRLNGLSAASTLEEMSAVLQRMAVFQAVPQMAAALDPTDPEAGEIARLAELLPADETQLLYSMCLHGRAELGLAPDEYAALTMVLLRLLAFKSGHPHSENGSAEKKTLKPASAAPEPAAAVAQAPAVAAAKPVSAPVSSVGAAPVSAPPPAAAAPQVAAPTPVHASIPAPPSEPVVRAAPPEPMPLPRPAPSSVTPVAAAPSAPVIHPAPVAAVAPPVQAAAPVQNPEPPAQEGRWSESADDGDAGGPPPWADEWPDDGSVAVTPAPTRGASLPVREPGDSPSGGVAGGPAPDLVAMPVRVQPEPGERTQPRYDVHAASRVAPTFTPTEDGEFWHATVQQLAAAEAITALVRELALQSQLVARDGQHWMLRVERESLNQPNSRERLRQALQQAGLASQITVELGVVIDSPARRNATAAAARQKLAEEIILGDPFVQSVMRDFGAKIVPGSIKSA